MTHTTKYRTSFPAEWEDIAKALGALGSKIKGSDEEYQTELLDIQVARMTPGANESFRHYKARNANRRGGFLGLLEGWSENHFSREEPVFHQITLDDPEGAGSMSVDLHVSEDSLYVHVMGTGSYESRAQGIVELLPRIELLISTDYVDLCETYA